MNLNTSAEPKTTVERFNPSRPQGSATTFRPTFGTFVYALFAAVGVTGIGAFALVGLAGGGTYPDLRKSLATPAPLPSPGDSTYQAAVQKTTEEELKEVFDTFVSSWNAGWEGGQRPTSIFAPDVTVQIDKQNTSGTDIATSFDERTKIKDHRLDSFVLLSDDKALADATFFLKRRLTMREWRDDVKNPPNADSIVEVEREVRYGFELDKIEGKWKISRQNWISKAPARIKAVEDSTAPELALSEGTTTSTDLRPSKDMLQPRYDRMAESFTSGVFPRGEFFKTYKLKLFGDEQERDVDQVAARLQKLHGKGKSITFKATVDGVSQADATRAFALVTYRVDLIPTGDTSNVYTATWQDKDTWGTAVGGGWYLLRSERQGKSSIADYYGY
jgi:hypothetical protein